MVISGIRKGVPENQRDHFVIVLHAENELKKFVGFEQPDDAYLVSLDASGDVVKQLHGAPDPATYKQLAQKLDSLLSPKR